MDKITINNQIVQMRKFVKQSKVHNINRLVKQVKLLQQRKGDEAQVIKAKRKGDRFLEEIAVLKKIKPDDVSKLALSKAKDWNFVLKQKDVPLEERCIAMLANYESVQKEVENFHKGKKDLVPKILVFLKEWNDKSKNPSNRSAKNLRASEMRLKNNKRQMSWVRNDTSSHTHDTVTQNKELEVTNTKLSIIPEKDNSEMREIAEVLSNTEFNESSNNVASVNSENEYIEHVSSSEEEICDESKSLTMEKHSESNRIRKQDILKMRTVSILPNASLGKGDFHAENEQEETVTNNTLDVNTKSSKPSEIENSFHDTITKFDLVPRLNLEKQKSANSLKAVTLLNLEELQGLDEIPINKLSDKDENSEDEQEEINKSDPFFLGSHEAISITSENSRSKTDENVFQNKNYHMPNKSEHFKRHERSNSYLEKKHFAPSNHIKNKYGFKKDDDHFRNRRKDNHKTNEKNFKIMRNKWENNSKMLGSNGPKQYFTEVQLKNVGKGRSFNEEKKTFPSKMSKKKDPPLHPSWEAKRRLKEVATTSVKGKRVVFND